MTSLCTRVYLCLLGPTTFITKIELLHLVGDREGLLHILPKCSAGYLELRRLKLKHTWQLTACLLKSSTAACPQAVQFRSRRWLSGCASGLGPSMPYERQKFNSCHYFSVKLSLCKCSRTESSCPSCWHTYAIPGCLWYHAQNCTHVVKNSAVKDFSQTIPTSESKRNCLSLRVNSTLSFNACP